MNFLNQQERRRVGELAGEAITALSEALAIVTKAKERVINGSVDVTIEYQLRDAIKAAAEASNKAVRGQSNADTR